MTIRYKKKSNDGNGADNDHNDDNDNEKPTNKQ